MTAGCDKGAVMEWSVSAFEAVAVMSLPVWLIVEGVLASLRPANPPSRKGSPQARAGLAPAGRPPVRGPRSFAMERSRASRTAGIRRRT
jgi:hypothetical protein